MEASGGSDTPDPRDQEHFVDKYKFHLIHYVRNTERILEELYVKGVIPLQSFLKIRKCQTAEKMWVLFHDLKDVGVEGKDIFYNILEKLEPDVIEKIKTTSVLESASGGQYSSGDSQAISFWESSLHGVNICLRFTLVLRQFISLSFFISVASSDIHSHRGSVGSIGSFMAIPRASMLFKEHPRASPRSKFFT